MELESQIVIIDIWLDWCLTEDRQMTEIYV